MRNQIKRINFNHSFIFFLFCNIFSLITLVNNNLTISPLICFLLILSIGVSHGSLDNMKGKKLFEIFKINNFFIFYLSYILLAIFIIFFLGNTALHLTNTFFDSSILSFWERRYFFFSKQRFIL